MGVAAAVFSDKFGPTDIYIQNLPSDPPPTNQRAELRGIIIAIEQALVRYRELGSNPELDVKIYTDSTYAIPCMTRWVHTWRNNGWLNESGRTISNKDLVHEASMLDEELGKLGSVEYILIYRQENMHADKASKQALRNLVREAAINKI
jgi:ribonuclease HI